MRHGYVATFSISRCTYSIPSAAARQPSGMLNDVCPKPDVETGCAASHSVNAIFHQLTRPACACCSFNDIIHGMFADGSMPPGDVVDAGAHKGQWACMYACLQPARTVRAIDPSPAKVANLACRPLVRTAEEPR